MPGQGYRLNPFETTILQNVVQHGNPSIAQDLLPLVLGTVEGAQARRAENVAVREAGLGGLQELAMSLASQGADEDAVANAVLGQAASLPGMQRQGALEDLLGLSGFVGGLYEPGMPVSGLVPYDVRAALPQPGTLDAETQQELGTLMAGLVGEGQPAEDVMLQVQRALTSTGADPATIEAGMATATRMYEDMAGISPAGFSSISGQVEEAGGDLEGIFERMLEEGSIDALPFPGVSGEDVDADALVAMMANEPGALQALIAELDARAMEPPSDSWWNPFD